MTKPLQRDAIYLQRHFDAEIVVLSVRWYIAYKLSYRDLGRDDGGARRCGFAGTVKLTAKLPKRPDRMGNVRRLRVLNSLGKLVQRERKAVTQHQGGGYRNTRSLT
jgi:hypothetical protein